MKKFGFGCMRFPLLDKEKNEVDLSQTTQMIDRFLAAGFTYFDTAHGYLDGHSETALRQCLTERYPRDAYQLTDKLSENFFQTEEDIRPFFESQLETLGVSYFDYYLMHSQNIHNYQKYVQCHAYEIAQELKKEGKIRHVGISFHDSAAMLDRILTEQPLVEVVQIQFNYADYDNAAIESRKCLEVCRRHHKPVIVMEPVRGGSLASLPPDAAAVLDALGGGSPASYALRFAASFDDVIMVLSGMSTLEQTTENLRVMEEFQPLSEEEFAALRKISQILAGADNIPCTACRYCVDGCPKQIPIPDLFGCWNSKKQFNSWDAGFYYNIHTAKGGKAGDCIGCGKCEHICPQHLEIRRLLKNISEAFDTH